MRRWTVTVGVLLGLAATGCAGGRTTAVSSFHGDLRTLVLRRSQLPAGFSASGPAITQDLYDESSPQQEPWLYVGDVRRGRLITAAFSEFRSRTGKIVLDSEAYSAPTLASAETMYDAATQLAARSANGVEVRRTVRRVQVGSAGVLLAGPGLNGEGAQAIVWRDGQLLGMVAVDGATASIGENLIQRLARRQQTMFEHAVTH